MYLRSVFLGRLVNRSTTTSFPSINQVTKLAATHQAVVLQRQVPQLQNVAKTVEVPPVPFIGRIVDVLVIMPLMQQQAPSESDCGEDGGNCARAIHRQNSGRACGVAATGPLRFGLY